MSDTSTEFSFLIEQELGARLARCDLRLNDRGDTSVTVAGVLCAYE